MTAYIEFVILDNLTLTFLIALCSYRFLRLKTRWIRCGICAILGTAVAIVFPFIRLHFVLLTAIKIVLGILLSFILFYKACNVAKGFIVFLILTFMFGGLLFCVGLMFYGDINKALTLPVSNLPLFIVAIAVTVIVIIVRCISLKYHRATDLDNYILNIGVEIFNKNVKARGFLDTGNRLYDTKSGLPIIIFNFKCIMDALSDQQVFEVLSGNGEKVFKNAHYINYSTLGGADKLLVFSPDNFYFYFRDKANILRDVMIGLRFTQIKDSLEYDAILHPSIINAWRH